MFCPEEVYVRVEDNEITVVTTYKVTLVNQIRDDRRVIININHLTAAVLYIYI